MLLWCVCCASVTPNITYENAQNKKSCARNRTRALFSILFACCWWKMYSRTSARVRFFNNRRTDGKLISRVPVFHWPRTSSSLRAARPPDCVTRCINFKVDRLKQKGKKKVLGGRNCREWYVYIHTHVFVSLADVRNLVIGKWKVLPCHGKCAHVG